MIAKIGGFRRSCYQDIMKFLEEFVFLLRANTLAPGLFERTGSKPAVLKN